MGLISYDSIADEAWRLLVQAGDDPSHPMRVVVLATRGDATSPEARLMVLRGADRPLGALWFYTDLRSPKVEQLRTCPTVSVVAWDRACGVQLRIRGTASIDWLQVCDVDQRRAIMHSTTGWQPLALAP